VGLLELLLAATLPVVYVARKRGWMDSQCDFSELPPKKNHHGGFMLVVKKICFSTREKESRVGKGFRPACGFCRLEILLEELKRRWKERKSLPMES
jgi:hypothetical protein